MRGYKEVKENLGSDQGQAPLFQNYKTEEERQLEKMEGI